MRTDEKITLWSERIHEFQSMNIPGDSEPPFRRHSTAVPF